MQHLGNVKGKFIVSVEAENAEVSLNDDDATTTKDTISEDDKKELLQWFSNVLKFQLKDVTASNRLVSSPPYSQATNRKLCDATARWPVWPAIVPSTRD